MDIKPLDKKTYAGRKFTARYHTNGYYDICPDERGFQVQYKLFDAPVERSFDDLFYGEWLEVPVAFGAFEGETLVGYIEGPPKPGTTASASAISAYLTIPSAARAWAPGSSHPCWTLHGPPVPGCSFWKHSPATKMPSPSTGGTASTS